MNKIRLATPMGENDRHSSPIGQLNLCQNQVLSILSELDTSLNVRILRLLLERLNQLSYRSKYLSRSPEDNTFVLSCVLGGKIKINFVYL